jgi:hypothetical protein
MIIMIKLPVPIILTCFLMCMAEKVVCGLTTTTSQSTSKHRYFWNNRNRFCQRQSILQVYGTNDQRNDDSDESQIVERKEKGIFDLIFNPYESKIPKEIEKDIYEAEGNTSAAKDRTQRITYYAIAAFTGVLMAFFNGFLTEIRSSPTPDGTIPSDDILDTIGFGWVYTNILFTFLFTNKIGGILCLLTGGACGLLAEAEYDTRRINAEKIYDEILRRRASKDTTKLGTATKKNTSSSSTKSSNRRRSGKEAKRINALTEVAFDLSLKDTTTAKEKQPTADSEKDVNDTVPDRVLVVDSINNNSDDNDKSISNGANENNKNNNIFSQMKDLYQQADTIAATQALLLNKKLEDEGILPKITDETGLKVIQKNTTKKE